MSYNFDNMALTDRLNRLKSAYLKAVPSISTDRAVAFTEVAKEYPDLPANLRIAKSFRRACETAPLLIQEGELIVGNPCGKPRAGALSPDIAWEWLEEELDDIGTRPQDPYYISEEDKKLMREEIFPFWKGKSLCEACEEKLRETDPLLYEYGVEAAITDLTYHMTSGGGDSSPGFDIILFPKGINGILAEAQEHLKALRPEDPEYDTERAFYESSVEICRGVLAYAGRLSDYALELAEKEKDPARRDELKKIAEINRRVPAEPPETFWEALQAVWTVESLFSLEANQCSTSLGRIDEYMYPCYQRSIESGELTEEEAFELFGCFMLKCSEVIWYTPGATAKYFAGYMPFLNMTVGGVGRDGGDVCNDLTFLVMEVVRKIKMYQPTLACRVHNASSHRYLDKIVDVIRAGGGMPAVHFDDAHTRMMLRKGYDLRDARDYSMMGCVEPQKNGRVHQWTAGGFTQWPACIDMAMHNGALPSCGERRWLDTGDVSEFDTFEKFETAVRRQLDFLIDVNCRGSNVVEEVFSRVTPTPYMSIFIDGCMQNGKDVMQGGAVMYEGPGSIFAGLGTYADSMAAVKKVVYEDRLCTLAELKQAMDADWVGFEKLRKACVDAPKYGNDDDYADRFAREIIDYTEEKMNSYPSLYARHIHGTLSQSFNTPLGEMVGATPDGRGSGEPLSDGMSPSQGRDRKGPTAVIKSVSRLNCESMSLGMSHNFKFSPAFLDTKEGRTGAVTLLKTASLLGNAQMQFNCVDDRELIDAREHPEKHRDLIVRVAGYSAFFTELCPEVQNEIISRTEIDRN
ncbi:choline trimethylamine-lyase [Hornefia porci]|uniref:Choline trimethylamine-lyase n=1 Tax=Hornefia porci TaxID=2652292 RepID=A0A1Q9JEY5_9FIRM|nr:choline trimethylamine-lyase [Hornefia porci]OLR54786.1 choline trimethylamine-lyase [Hornefia porci]